MWWAHIGPYGCLAERTRRRSNNGVGPCEGTGSSRPSPGCCRDRHQRDPPQRRVPDRDDHPQAGASRVAQAPAKLTSGASSFTRHLPTGPTRQALARRVRVPPGCASVMASADLAVRRRWVSSDSGRISLRRPERRVGRHRQPPRSARRETVCCTCWCRTVPVADGFTAGT